MERGGFSDGGLAWLAVVLVVTSVGCAEHVANLCPNAKPPRCMTDTVCEYDAHLGCNVCRCASPYMVPVTQPLQGDPQPVPQ